MPNTDDLRKELEEIQQELETLKEGTRAHKTLLAEKASLEAKLIGAGAIAQGQDARAAGKQAVIVDGDVGGSINTGTVNYFFNHYEASAEKARLAKVEFERILREYLAWVVKAYGKARLYGLESLPTTRDQPRRQLADVFVPLTLRRFSPPSRDEIEEMASEFKGDPLARQRAYMRAVDNHRKDGEEIQLKLLLTIQDRLAVVGGAGCGKSTLAAYLAASLAQAALSGRIAPVDLPKQRKQLLPLLIPLRYYREYQRICGEAPAEKLKKPRTGKLAGFIPWYLMRRSPALELSEDFFDRLLLGGGCLLILDGLDEVVSRSERGQVKTQVEVLANDIYPGNMILVTARESGYREDAVFGDDFVRLDVQPLDDNQIGQLAHNWCQQLYPEAVESQTREVVRAIQEINGRNESQDLPRLVNTPLMTTMVVSVKWGEDELPRERAKLYEAAVKVILQAQYLENDDSQKELVNWSGNWEEQRQWLSFLALEMHRGGRDGAAIPEERLHAILKTYPGMDEIRLNNFIMAVRLRGGLFEERGELFQFAHLTFQEFLAARLLVQQREKGLATLHPYVTIPWWREVCLLFYGIARADYSIFSSEYLTWLEQLEPEETRLAGLELAAAAILEIEKPDSTLRKAQAKKLCRAFEGASLSTTPNTRVRAGNTLSVLGDPRFDPERWFLPRGETMGFLKIQAGEFIMGADRFNDEKPRHELNLSYDYWLAKYPVTVAQFRAFATATGTEKEYEHALRRFDNHPVRNIAWFDAIAYCDWLTPKLVVASKDFVGLDHPFWDGIRENMLQVTLPSEAEWEKAARGVYGGEYPWNNIFDPNRANTTETDIWKTSPVGAFPGGVSPYGLLDMSGNVWEWTRSLLRPFPYNPQDGREKAYTEQEYREYNRTFRTGLNINYCLRGGSFSSLADFARCAFRRGVGPGFADGLNGGFRVVVCSPFFSS